MATYKATIEFKTDQDEEDFRQNMLDCLDSCCFEYLEISNLEKVSISAEEAIEQIKELKKNFPSLLPVYWNDKLNKILDSVD
jgi:hypothetical protein